MRVVCLFAAVISCLHFGFRFVCEFFYKLRNGNVFSCLLWDAV